MNDQNTCPSCGGPYGEHASDCTALEDVTKERDALRTQIEELHQQDRLKTLEINTLVPENRSLIAHRDELRDALARCVRALGVARARLNIEYETPAETIAEATLAKTAPVNPNAGVVQASPKGRWTLDEAKAEGLKIMEEEEKTTP